MTHSEKKDSLLFTWKGLGRT